MNNISKLAELRAKTDRQLLELVVRKLDGARTECAREEVRRFLPYLTRADRRGIERRLDELARECGTAPEAVCF